jgi:hypothetical protein
MILSRIARFLAPAALVISFEAVAGSGVLRLSNAKLQIGLDQERGTLVEFVNRTTRQNMLDTAGMQPGLWQIEIEGEAVGVNPADARTCEVIQLPGKPAGARLHWTGFIGRAAGLQVEAVVRLDEKLPVSRWTIRVWAPDAPGLRRVQFPRMGNLVRQPRERLAVPMWMGQLADDPRAVLSGRDGQGARLEWAYPGLLSLQCLAFYAESGTGLYLAANDTAAFRKTFAMFGDKTANIGCETVHVPEQPNAPGLDWQLPYEVVLGTFEGDWVTAAEQYRSWATNQTWATQSRLALGLVPNWITNTALWVWNRGRSDAVLTPAVVLQKKLNLPVSVFWHWWHGCSYDAGFPEYLPPREGTERFARALAAAHDHQVRALVYMNQRLWGMTTKSWRDEGAERFAVKGPDGKIQPEIYNTFTRQPCAAMCMGTAFWRHKYAGLAERAVVDLGVDGIYMDQACTSLACYDSAHGHPRGGGTYWMHGFRRMQEDIRGRCERAGAGPERPVGGRHPVALAGEGCGEPWLPYLDLMLSLQVSKERYAALDGWETIPFFHAVYHPYSVTYGNYSSLTMPPYDDLWPAEFAPKEPLRLLDRKFSRQFLMEQARAFVWGQQPTIANFMPAHLEERKDEMSYVLKLAALRARATTYLLHGTYLRPPEFPAPTAILEMSRLSIYAGQQSGLTEFQKEFPLVWAGAWRAPNGNVAFALASIADKPLDLPLTVDARYYGISPRARVTRIDEHGNQSIGRLAPESALKVTLPSHSACLLEFSP